MNNHIYPSSLQLHSYIGSFLLKCGCGLCIILILVWPVMNFLIRFDFRINMKISSQLPCQMETWTTMIWSMQLQRYIFLLTSRVSLCIISCCHNRLMLTFIWLFLHPLFGEHNMMKIVSCVPAGGGGYCLLWTSMVESRFIPLFMALPGIPSPTFVKYWCWKRVFKRLARCVWKMTASHEKIGNEGAKNEKKVGFIAYLSIFLFCLSFIIWYVKFGFDACTWQIFHRIYPDEEFFPLTSSARSLEDDCGLVLEN